MANLTLLQKIAIWVLPVLFAITVHEVAHGWVANKLGDPTAKMLGRLTLNPIKHIDPIGTIIVPALLLWIGGFVFGWAKPVPVTWNNLKHPKRDMILVAAAGPMANLIMALIWAGVMKIGTVIAPSTAWLGIPLAYMGQAGIIINLVLMIVNLIPIPPLDGGRVVSGLLPGRLAYYYDRVEPFGFLIIVLLLATGLLKYIISPPVLGLWRVILKIFGF